MWFPLAAALPFILEASRESNCRSVNAGGRLFTIPVSLSGAEIFVVLAGRACPPG
jgi:hypothetical protein